MSALTSILVRDRAVPVRKIEEALQRQVVAGGELETALLEVGALPENVLAAYRAALFGLLPATRSDVMGVGDDLVRLVPRDLAVRHQIVPLRREGRVLVVASATPLAPEADQGLGARLGHDIVYRIVLDVRLELALGAHYGREVTGRAARLGDRLAREPAGHPPYVAPLPLGEAPPAPLVSAAAAASGAPVAGPARPRSGLSFPDHGRGDTREIAVPPPPEAPRVGAAPAGSPSDTDRTLVDAPAPPPGADPDPSPDDDPTRPLAGWTGRRPERLPTGSILRADVERAAGNAPPARRDTDPMPPPVFTAPPPEPTPRSGKGEGTARYGQVRDPVSGRGREPFRPSRHPTRRPKEEAAAASLRPPSIASAGASFSPTATPSGLPPAPPAPPPGGPSSAPPPAPVPDLLGGEALSRLRRRRGPLPYDEAVALLGEATSRDAVLLIAFAYARQFFEHAALFVAQEAYLVLVEAGAGRGEGRGRRFPLAPGSTARKVLDHGAPAQADLRAPEPDRELAAAPGSDHAQPCVLLPATIRGRAVVLIYGDQAGEPVALAELSELLAFVPRISEAFERLILERKTGGGPRGTVPSPPPREVLEARIGVPRRPPSPPPPPPPPPPSSGAGRTAPSSSSRPAEASGLPSRGARRGGGAPAGSTYHVGPREEIVDRVARVGPAGRPGAAAPGSDRAGAPGDRPSVPRPDEPSVIVDMGDQVDALVRNLMTFGPEDTQDPVDALLRQGEAALPGLVAHFPGPLWFDRLQPHRRLPSGRDVSAIARALVAFRGRAVPYVASLVSAGDPEVRFYAVLVSSELVDRRLLPSLVPRAFDDDEGVRALALRVLGLYRRYPEALREALHPIRAEARHPRRDGRDRRLAAVDALGALRDRAALEPLIGVLESAGDDDDLRAAARRALVLLTRQDFGDSPQRWLSWAEKQEGRHRIEWLIDALLHPEEEMRGAAGEELQQLTQQYLGYHPSLPRRDREIAHRKYRSWWEQEGRIRHPGG